MAIKGRQTLYSIFVNGAVPTQKDYRDLIDSALNRRDDHFFGEWQKGMKYCEGDVIIYGKALYKLVLVEQGDPCPPGEEEKVTDDGCYCSVIEPSMDKNWCVLELDLKDKDWEIICEPEGDPDGKAVTIYQETAQVGIGTDDPKARLDITDRNKILLEPNDAGSPAIIMGKFAEQEGGGLQKYVKYRLSEEVCWETDAMAYLFKLVKEKIDEPTSKKKAVSNPDTSPPELLLMKVTADNNKVPRVGIGTAEPKGGLHVRQEDRGHIVVNPAGHKEPGILLADLQASGNGYYHLVGINDAYTFFCTNAAGGFRFKKDNTDVDELMDCSSADEGENLVAILGDGRVGVGTVDPKSYVEITDDNSGSFRFQLGNDEKDVSNPVISINNLRPTQGEPNSYLSVGVDDSYGTFITDAVSGFVFKKGGPHGVNDNEVDINQGDSLVYIAPNGKVGIGTKSALDVYDLDVHGQTRAYASYLQTDSNSITKKSNLKDEDKKKFLEKFSKLNPIRFAWKEETHIKEDVERIGFNAHNVFEAFPELVKKTGPDEKAIAYGNLTAVLVQIVQDQQVKLGELEDRICDLEAKLGIGND